MIVIGTLLLDQDDVYLREDGSLPTRPSYDKDFLRGLCLGMKPSVSMNTRLSLPVSITSVLKWSAGGGIDIALSPDKIDAYCDVLIIIRSQDDRRGGKRFRFDKFDCILKLPEIEIYRRKQ